jgi:hypothetical protein
MSFPTTLDELRHEGYLYKSTIRCRGCQAVIEFWVTPESQQLGFDGQVSTRPRKLIPLDIDGQGKVVPHWSTCPKAAEFRSA